MWIKNAQIRLLYPNSNFPAASLPYAAVPSIDISPHDTYTDPDTVPYTTHALSSSPLYHLLRKSTWANRGTWTNTIHQHEFLTLRYLIPHYPINMIFLSIMQLLILNSKPFFFIGPTPVHTQLVCVCSDI